MEFIRQNLYKLVLRFWEEESKHMVERDNFAQIETDPLFEKTVEDLYKYVTRFSADYGVDVVYVATNMGSWSRTLRLGKMGDSEARTEQHRLLQDDVYFGRFLNDDPFKSVGRLLQQTGGVVSDDGDTLAKFQVGEMIFNKIAERELGKVQANQS